MNNAIAHLANYPAPIRLGIFIIILLLLWLPLAIPIYLLGQSDPNLVTILAMGLLYLIFLGLLGQWNLRVYNIRDWWRSYGLEFSRKNRTEWLKGLSLGLLLVIILFGLEAAFGWVKIQPSAGLFKIILEGFLSATGIGLAEELFFRGWLLEELQKDYSRSISLWANAILFAALHFIKPLAEIMRTFPQFPALVILGLTLVWARRGHGQRLGICIGIHSGLVWGYYIFNVGKLLTYTRVVPDWMTGIDNNPLVSLMGITFLLMLAALIRNKAQRKNK